jgi:hypothetical protein
MEPVTPNTPTIRVFRYGFRPGYYAEALDAAGNRLAFTGVFAGPGGKRRAIEAALAAAKTGHAAPGDRGCPG